MKALYALVFVCVSFHAFAASAETLDNSTDYPSYLNDFNYLDDLDDLDVHVTGQSTTRVPGMVIAPAVEPDTLIFDQDGAENNNTADTVPGIPAIQPSDEDLTGSFAEVRDRF